MEKRYLEPEMEIVNFATADVILASPAEAEQSSEDFTGGIAGPIIP